MIGMVEMVKLFSILFFISFQVYSSTTKISENVSERIRKLGASFHPGKLSRYVSCRSQQNNNNSSIWAYEGRLMDPYNGRLIAEVEGAELVKHISSIYPSSFPKNNNDLKSLALYDVLSNSTNWDFAGL